MRTALKTLALGGLALTLLGAGVVYSGVFNVAADDAHFAPVQALLEIARERSVAARTQDIQPPNLSGEALIRSGAGNYDAMCVGCHLAPGMPETELSQGLYPAPPNLSRRGTDGDPAAAFWTIKHGIKATGMPAWGKSMGDQYIWGMVAFLEQLPSLDARQYQALVAASDGHQHGGGESAMHDHGHADTSEKAAPPAQPHAHHPSESRPHAH